MEVKTTRRNGDYTFRGSSDIAKSSGMSPDHVACGVIAQLVA